MTTPSSAEAFAQPEGSMQAPDDSAPTEPPKSPATQPPLRSVATGALALLSTQPLTWSASLLAAAFIPRYLGAADLGLIALAGAITLATSIFSELGVTTHLTRDLGSEKRPQHQGNSAFTLIFLSSLVAHVLTGALLLLTDMSTRELTVIWLSLIGAAFGIMACVPRAFVLGKERHVLYAWLTAMTSAVATLAGLAVLVLGGGVVAFCAVGAVVSGLMLVLSVRFADLRIQRSSIDPENWKKLTRRGFPFMTTNLVTWVYAGGNKLLLVGFAGEAALGWNATAYRIVSVAVFVPTLVSTPLLPVLSREGQSQEDFARTLRQSLRTVLILVMPIGAMMLGLAPYIPDILGWPAEFDRCIVLVKILAFEQPLVAVDIVLSVAVMALHRERRWVTISLAAAVASVLLNVTLIPFFQHHSGNGAIGADIATIATEATIMVGAIMLLPRGLLGRETVFIALRVILASATIVAVMAVVAPTSLPLAVVAAGAGYVVAILALRVVRADEIRAARAFAVQSLNRRASRASR